MTSFQDQITQALNTFINTITDLALDAARQVLSQDRTSAAVPLPDKESAARVARAKRSAGDLEALGERFAAFVRKNPGLRIEQVNKQLGTTTKDLALPIRQFLASGRIKTKGRKRSTTYFAGKKT